MIQYLTYITIAAIADAFGLGCHKAGKYSHLLHANIKIYCSSNNEYECE